MVLLQTDSLLTSTQKSLQFMVLSWYHRPMLWPCKTSRDWLKNQDAAHSRFLFFVAAFGGWL